MRQLMKFLMFSVTLFLYSVITYASEAIENRCGWFDNPTPANAWFHDKNGEWEISLQGGPKAKGKLPAFNVNDEATFVHTNGGSYGYGCTCMKLIVDSSKHRIKEIKSFNIRKLSVCRADSKLKEPENPLQ